MFKINKMYSEHAQGGAGGEGGNRVFEYIPYDAIVADIEKKKNELFDLCNKPLVSRDVESAFFLDALNQKLNELPGLGKEIVELLEKMIESMKNVSANYRAAEARAESNIMNS